MNRYVKLLAMAVLLAEVVFQAGCDQNGAITEDPESPAVLGKGTGTEDLGARLAKDPDFHTLRRVLHDADMRARLKYFAGADLKRDQAFAKLAAKKHALSASDKSRLARIRGLEGDEIQQIHDLREAILSRFPEIKTLSEEQLQDVLLATGLGKNTVVGKTQVSCYDCNYAYNTCISSAEFRHAIETMSCALFIETVFGGTACYLASLTKYMWSIHTCSQTLSYCLSSNDCLNKTAHDTN